MLTKLPQICYHDVIERNDDKMPLKPFKTRKESLLPVMDVYLNVLQEIWVFNVDLKRNTDLNSWIQLKVTCPKCHWYGVERLVGDGYKQHIVTVNHQQLIKEMYICACPFCENHWMIDATRPYNPKTLAMSINDDLNDGISEVDEEIKEKNNEI